MIQTIVQEMSYSALSTSRDHFSQNNSRNTPRARPQVKSYTKLWLFVSALLTCVIIRKQIGAFLSYYGQGIGNKISKHIFVFSHWPSKISRLIVDTNVDCLRLTTHCFSDSPNVLICTWLAVWIATSRLKLGSLSFRFFTHVCKRYCQLYM